MKDERIDCTENNGNRKKKVSNVILKYTGLFLIVVLAFVSGFNFGCLYGMKNIPAVSTPEEVSVIKEEPDKNKAEAEGLEALKKEFAEIMKAKYPDVELSFAVKNLDTGVSVIYNNKKMNSASVIKLFIMENVYNKVSEGSYELTDEREKDLTLMITESNNKAANNFIDDFGGQNEKRKVDETNEINKLIKKRGYKFTELNRKMYDTLPPEGPSGYQNYTCVEDVCVFLEGIYNKTLMKEPYNTYAMKLLKNQKRRAKIPARIMEKYPDVVVANKTGELSQVENDAALIMSDEFNLIFVVMTDNIPFMADGGTDYMLKENVQDTISDLSLKLVDFYKENHFSNN